VNAATATAASSGYSGTPLAQKLGLKDGQRVLFLDLPDSLAALAEARAFATVRKAGWPALQTARAEDFIHGFTASRTVLEDNATRLRHAVAAAGTIWISWPKQASKVITDITENVIREVLLPTGLVDVKVAAIDDIWSGLKLVIRKELR
jgi:hypothetical protein